ncbi:putative ribonuclease H-like domain-containing protein [Tanacetum coccineum]
MVNLPNGKRATSTKWVFRNKKNERGIVVRNKAKLVTQGYTQEKGIGYDKVFTPVVRIEAIRLFLAYASFMGFIVYPMDIKSAFLYGTIEEEVYVCQLPGFEDLQFPDKVYKVEKALYGLHQAPKAWYETLSTYLIEHGFRRGTIDKTLFIKQDKGDILLVHVYVNDIIFGSTKKSLCDKFEGLMHKRFQMSSMGELTFFLRLQMEPNKALVRDEEADSVDVHLYRLMIGLLMYLTTSRPDITFVVCTCTRFQVTPKMSHLHDVQMIFRYLKGQPKLGLWYPRDSSFDLGTFLDSVYAGASLDRKSTIGGCQFLSKRLISWQCKKQTIVANSTIEAEYVAIANFCGQVLWIQNQMLDYGNFMNTKIYIDNESTICIVKNPAFYSKTKHIEIRHHFIRDSYEKRLIQVIKIHTDHNVADLLIKAFDVSRFNFLVASIVNSVKQIHAIVDGKAVIILESSVRNDLLFDDEDGITCLTNDDIFENLALMGYEQLSTKLTFQKGNFDSKKFLMYPRFLQLFLNNQLKDLPEPINDTYETPSHTKKVFSNMARQSKGFSGKVTPLFDSMLVQNHASEGEGGSPRGQETMGVLLLRLGLRVLEKPNEPPLLEGHTSGSREGSMEHTFELIDIVPPAPHDSPLTGGYTLGSDEGRLKLKELMAMCTKLSKQVLDLEKEKDAQAVEILKLKQRVKKLERKRKSSILHPRRRIYKQVESSDDDLDEEDASEQGRKSDKTKSMFKDSDFDVLDDNMENVEGETVNTATTGVSDVSAPVTTAGVAISTSKPRTPPTTATTAFIDEDLKNNIL